MIMGVESVRGGVSVTIAKGTRGGVLEAKVSVTSLRILF